MLTFSYRRALAADHKFSRHGRIMEKGGGAGVAPRMYDETLDNRETNCRSTIVFNESPLALSLLLNTRLIFSAAIA